MYANFNITIIMENLLTFGSDFEQIDHDRRFAYSNSKKKLNAQVIVVLIPEAEG